MTDYLQPAIVTAISAARSSGVIAMASVSRDLKVEWRDMSFFNGGKNNSNESAAVEGRRAQTQPAPAPIAPTSNPRANAKVVTRAEVQPADGVVIGASSFMKGEIRNCTHLEVFGQLEGDFEAGVLVVQASGRIAGTVKCENASIHGIVDGDLLVRQRLDIHSNGRLNGDVRYGELSIEAGGLVTGSLKKHSDDEAGQQPNNVSHLPYANTHQ
jgi:cytoskeletal protein CcmA (bactofilin family)